MMHRVMKSAVVSVAAAVCVLGAGVAGASGLAALPGAASVAVWQAAAGQGTGQAAGQPAVITQDDFVTGTMDIEFGTRTNLDTTGELKEGSASVGAKDVYKFALRVAQTTEFSGQVTRQPNLYTRNFARRKQDAQLFYDINLIAYNPADLKQFKAIGKWVGTVPIDTATGAFDLAGGKAKESALRIQVDAVGRAPAFQEMFTGKLVGKAEQKENLAEYTFRRVVGTRTVEVKVAKSDPMRFDNITLATGPAQIYPRTRVNGRLDYDYETGNWYTDGISFRYTLDGKEFEDVVTGSIKWVEDPDRASNGKGYYEFNLRFNEAQNAAASTEADAFAAMSDEEAFFAVDTSIPALTGRIGYVDTMSADGETPVSSKVTYNLNANKLTKQQAVNFFKLWMLGIGPINDE